MDVSLYEDSVCNEVGIDVVLLVRLHLNQAKTKSDNELNFFSKQVTEL